MNRITHIQHMFILEIEETLYTYVEERKYVCVHFVVSSLRISDKLFLNKLYTVRLDGWIYM
jgi:hypothetical protein